MINQKDNDSANERDKDAPNIEPSDTVPANRAEDDAANDTAYNSQNYVAKRAFARFIHYATGEITANQPNENPGDNSRTLIHRLIIGLSQSGSGKY